MIKQMMIENWSYLKEYEVIQIFSTMISWHKSANTSHELSLFSAKIHTSIDVYAYLNKSRSLYKKAEVR